MNMSDALYARLGVRPFINCCGTRTVLLGTSGDSAPGPLNMREFGSASWTARRLG